ncbi:MAG: amidohydrolase family protein [Anaerolineales bacterium]
MPLIILCGTLFDGETDETIKGAWLSIEDGVIASVLDHKPARSGAFLDLSRYTVLPGFIDCHDHVCLDPGDEIAQAKESSPWLAVRGAARLKTIVEAGITTLRNAGEHERLDLVLKRAVESGLIPGPRLLTAGMWICRTGGHGWFDEKEADGPWEIRKAIREEVKHGADWIKIMVTGGISTEHSDATMSDFNREEIFVAVEEAHRLGKKIAAHAHGGEGVDSLIEAGVDSLEHGFYLTRPELHEMAKKGIPLCSTYGIIDAIIREPQSPEFSRQNCLKVAKTINKMLTNAIQENVSIVVGTDGNHGKMAIELDALIRAGYSHVQALKALTSIPARLLGLQDQVGTLKKGLKADLVVVDGDPFNNIHAIGNVKMVIKDGQVIFKDVAE